MKDKKHGLSSDDGDTLLDLLQDMAQSSSSVDDDKPLDHLYHQNVNNLMESKIRKDNSSVKWLQVSGYAQNIC